MGCWWVYYILETFSFRKQTLSIAAARELETE
jgi:hypothetical protein